MEEPVTFAASHLRAEKEKVLSAVRIPEDIAAGVAYLASDDAAFVTGLELYIDGGYMAR